MKSGIITTLFFKILKSMYKTKVKEFCSKGYENWNEYVKMLLFKNDEDIFDKIDFYHENLYNHPLLIAFFNSNEEVKNNKNKINSLLYQAINDKSNILVDFDKYQKIYLPNIGWIHNKNTKNKTIEINDLDTKSTNYLFEKSTIIENTSIELLRYPIELLNQCYGEFDYEITQITQKHETHLSKAYQLIQKYIPHHFELINQYANKCVIFNTDPINKNSFAHKSAMGVAFYNAYQKNYNEVFFIDDIAHQTGHCLIFTLLFDKKQFFLIDDEDTLIQSLASELKNNHDNRNVEIWFHALYTYYTIFTCLDACIESKVFNQHQEYEALGRILLYIYKCHYDLSIISTPIDGHKLYDIIDESKRFNEDKSKQIFTEDGLIIFNEIKNKWNEVFIKYYPRLKELSLHNQSYNFDYQLFLKANPL